MTRRSVVHVEIPAANREESAKFYSQLFGWDFQHFGEPMNYTTFQAGNLGGGYFDTTQGAKVGDVRVYIESEDIDADLKNIEKAGGKTATPKTEIPGYGWFATFTDPSGNTMALYTGQRG